LDFSLGTDGAGFESLIVKNGAMRNHLYTDDSKIDNEGNIISDDNLYMDGANVFSFTIREVPKLVKDVLAKNNIKQDDIDLFIFHQANQYMLEHLRKKLKITDDKFFIYMKDVGNTVSSTIPIALYEAQKQNNLLNKKVLLAGFGVGLSWGGVVLKY
jgi:3-oxoacyl-[acyl-carrier-protein] synthase-3